MSVTKMVSVLPSLNFNQTIEFYKKLIEEPEVFKTQDYLILQFTRSQFELHFYLTQNPKDGECSGMYICVKNIKNYFDQALLLKCRVLKTLRREPWGQNEFCILDPSGCLLRFGEPAIEARTSLSQ